MTETEWRAQLEVAVVGTEWTVQSARLRGDCRMPSRPCRIDLWGNKDHVVAARKTTSAEILEQLA
jgi:hypothetical protein